jgi:hypothetical protein
MASSYKGGFKPKNPQKYLGDSNNIIYRSLWEFKFMRYLDEHKDIINWASEELAINYLSPVDKKIHRYFPDFIVKKKNKDGTIDVVMVEIKPSKQTVAPIEKTKKKRQYISEVLTYAINEAKWKAATDYCLDRKWKFLIITEKELGIKF